MARSAPAARRDVGATTAPDLKLGDLIGYRIRRLNNLLTQHSKLLSSQVLGLPLAQSRVLYELGMRGPSNPRVIAAATGLERSHVTQAVRDLIARKLVSRAADEQDGRSVVLSLTPTGSALLRRGIAASKARRDFLDQALSPAERQAFDEALTKLTDAAEQLLQTGPTGTA